VRQALHDDQAGGVPIPKGSLVLIAPWVMHRHRRFRQAPERFDPSRFMPDAPPPPRFAYIPFGAGPRICVGSPFALTDWCWLWRAWCGRFESTCRRAGR
jgi:cytochrome P450